jgi:hypothetical protein
MHKRRLVYQFKKQNLISFLIFFISFFTNTGEISTVYGSCFIEEPVLVELIECPAMQRLKDIHQYGISYCIGAYKSYSRFEHSLGVFYLVKKFGGTLQEQIAALLHDVSHTVFSHVGDHVFKHYCHKNSYQDNVHCWLINQTEIPAILSKYGISVEAIDHKKGNFSMLEQDIPDLCADRLEYILFGGLIEDQLTQEDINEIIAAIKFENGFWFFSDVNVARKCAKTSLYLTEHTFGSAWNFAVYEWAAKAVRRAVKIGLITLNDIHFSVDSLVWHLLQKSDDPKIQLLVENLCNSHEHYCQVTADQKYDLFIEPKFRGIDPLVKTDKGLERLTSLDPSYTAVYQALQQRLKAGCYLRFK